MAPGDVVIGISTSGRSPNVLRAMEYANQHGGISIGITGQAGQALKAIASLTLVIASTSVQRIEDVAGVAAHLACLHTRAKIAGLGPTALTA
jgi:D-sedoheptulose 7-phosphate isomerase